MIEYIKKDDVINLIEEDIPVDKDVSQEDIDDLLADIRRMEASNVRDNINGEWSHTEGDIIGVYECSACGSIAFRDYNFCPTCGADMRH